MAYGSKSYITLQFSYNTSGRSDLPPCNPCHTGFCDPVPAVQALGTRYKGAGARSLIGCIILILLQLSLCALRFISSSTHLHNIDFPPIFERLVASLTILWVIWTLFTGSQRKTATTVCITLSLTLIVLALVSVLIKPHFAVIFLINPLALDFIWQLIALLMIVIGIILAISRPPMTEVLNISLLGLACGHLLQTY